jgi:hypothetical protein
MNGTTRPQKININKSINIYINKNININIYEQKTTSGLSHKKK